jgi:rubrerythrin
VKSFAELTEREILAVAIFAEEEDSRIYTSFAEDLAERYPDSTKLFEKMAEEETGHRHQLLNIYQQTLWPQPAAYSPRGREGVSEAAPDLADQELASRCHSQRSANDGVSGRAFLHQSS